MLGASTGSPLAAVTWKIDRRHQCRGRRAIEPGVAGVIGVALIVLGED